MTLTPHEASGLRLATTIIRALREAGVDSGAGPSLHASAGQGLPRDLSFRGRRAGVPARSSSYPPSPIILYRQVPLLTSASEGRIRPGLSLAACTRVYAQPRPGPKGCPRASGLEAAGPNGRSTESIRVPSQVKMLDLPGGDHPRARRVAGRPDNSDRDISTSKGQWHASGPPPSRHDPRECFKV